MSSVIVPMGAVLVQDEIYNALFENAITAHPLNELKLYKEKESKELSKYCFNYN